MSGSPAPRGPTSSPASWSAPGSPTCRRCQRRRRSRRGTRGHDASTRRRELEMVDLRKEIKLSDLKPKRKPKAAGPAATVPAKSRRPRKSEFVGLKVGGSQLAAAHVINDGGARLMRVARKPLDAGIVVSGEVRDITALARAL